jgi:glutamine cyclotransferase
MKIALAAAAIVLAGTAYFLQTRERPVLPAAGPALRYAYDVVNRYPHDPEAFTQGLIYRDGFLFESTGLTGRSSLRKVKLETGEVVQRQDVDAQYFAEGLTEWAGRLVQLTWRTNIGFVYELASFRQVRTFSYRGEGWGLTHDGQRLIMSDGTSTLRFLDPATFSEVGQMAVRDGGLNVDDLNELEFVKGSIYANVWFLDSIAMIAPDSGQVTGWIDLRGLLPDREARGADVLNGIAYDAQGDRLFVTGKLWPNVFEIRVRTTR